MRSYACSVFGWILCIWILEGNMMIVRGSETRQKRQAQFGEWTQSNIYSPNVQNWASSHTPSSNHYSRTSSIVEQGPPWTSSARHVRYSVKEPSWDSEARPIRFNDEDKSHDLRDSRGRSNSEGDGPSWNSGGSLRFSDENQSTPVSESRGRSNSQEKQTPASGGRFRFSEEDTVDEDRNLFRLNQDSLSPSSARSVDPPHWDANGFTDVSSRARHSGRQSKVSAIFDSDKPFDGNNEKAPQFYNPESVSEEIESGRHLSPDTLATISETLGAINTVGRYLVNYTRGGMLPSPSGDRYDTPPVPPKVNEDLPTAILTISKNVLGRNVTDSIAPLVRVLPIGKVTQESSINGARSCTTPNGKLGFCDDLSNCPQLLLNLSNLRQSICFKSLFVPGVCCPRRHDPTFDPEPPPPVQPPLSTTTRRPLILTTQIPVQLVTQSSNNFDSSTFNSIEYANEDCGVPEVAKFRVVGGEEALPGRWPWMAAIFLHGPRRTEFWCGGSLIGPKHILTAAHCTKDTRQRPFSARQFTVRLGDIDLRREDEPSAPQTYRVAKVRAHPRFSRVGFYNDIAVLVLERPVRRSRYVIPVCLPPPRIRNNNFIGESPTVIGWGTTYYGGKESTVQRQVALPVWKNEDCDRTYFQPITQNFICAGLKEGGKDACQGDSGGPLILKKEGKWMQIGIVSFGNKCGEPGYPGVYTRITEYLDWIKENTV